ncbi:MAG TPA: thioredoxin [Bacillus sp. (in: firmicutes)]|nr:thioredoxin [Bacillus sp. (in: firmicutes)]
MILNADGQEIFKELQTSNSVLIDCWAPWCPPCRMLAPVLEEIHQEFGIKIVKVNADDNEDFISKFQVLGLPTLLLFQDNQLVKRITGFQPKDALIDSLKKHGLVE